MVLLRLRLTLKLMFDIMHHFGRVVHYVFDY